MRKRPRANNNIENHFVVFLSFISLFLIIYIFVFPVWNLPSDIAKKMATCRLYRDLCELLLQVVSRLVVSCQQAGCNLFSQIVTSLQMTSCNNSVKLITCNKSVACLAACVYLILATRSLTCRHTFWQIRLYSG